LIFEMRSLMRYLVEAVDFVMDTKYTNRCGKMKFAGTAKTVKIRKQL
jgi:hypothetical protein